MRPRGLLATTVAMALANLTSFINLNWAHRFVVGVVITIFLTSYIILWFYWSGKNWARILVLIVSGVAVLDLVFLFYPRGNALLHDFSIIINALLGGYLLYWLNRAEARTWFRRQKTASSST